MSIDINSIKLLKENEDFKAIFYISKKNIKLSVCRNLMKRRIRSIIRNLIKEGFINRGLCFSFSIKKKVKIDINAFKLKILFLIKNQKNQKCGNKQLN